MIVNNYEKLYANMEVIKKKGCDARASLSLIENNPVLLEYTPEELDKKLSFIMNNDEIYAALFVNKDYYEWSIYENGTFSEFRSITVQGEESQDFIVDMVINFLYKRKIQQEIPDLPLEDLIETFKNDIKSNSTGYHLK